MGADTDWGAAPAASWEEPLDAAAAMPAAMVPAWEAEIVAEASGRGDRFRLACEAKPAERFREADTDAWRLVEVLASFSLGILKNHRLRKMARNAGLDGGVWQTRLWLKR